MFILAQTVTFLKTMGNIYDVYLFIPIFPVPYNSTWEFQPKTNSQFVINLCDKIPLIQANGLGGFNVFNIWTVV